MITHYGWLLAYGEFVLCITGDARSLILKRATGLKRPVDLDVEKPKSFGPKNITMKMMIHIIIMA